MNIFPEGRLGDLPVLGLGYSEPGRKCGVINPGPVPVFSASSGCETMDMTYDTAQKDISWGVMGPPGVGAIDAGGKPVPVPPRPGPGPGYSQRPRIEHRMGIITHPVVGGVPFVSTLGQAPQTQPAATTAKWLTLGAWAVAIASLGAAVYLSRKRADEAHEAMGYR